MAELRLLGPVEVLAHDGAVHAGEPRRLATLADAHPLVEPLVVALVRALVGAGRPRRWNGAACTAGVSPTSTAPTRARS